MLENITLFLKTLNFLSKKKKKKAKKIFSVNEHY